MSKSYKYKIYIVYGEDNLTLSSSGRSTMYDIKRAIAQRYEVPVANLEIRVGEDFKPLEMPESTLLRNTGIESGETLTIIEKEVLEDVHETSPLPSLKYDQVPDRDGLIMIRRVIPADNSCLFNSIAYAVEDKSRESAGYLRQIVASYIASDPEKYNELVLERSNEAYLEWIMDDLNWGGAIEIEILSSHYEVEICLANIPTMNISSFGTDRNYKRRIYILYDGAHYDVIARNISEDMEENTDITVFSPRDKFAEDGVLMLVRELHDLSSSLKIGGSESPTDSLSEEGMEERTTTSQQSCYQQASKYNFENVFNKMDALKES